MFFLCLDKNKKINTNIILKKFNENGISLHENHCAYSSASIVIYSDNLQSFRNDEIIIEGTINIVNKKDFEFVPGSDFDLVGFLYKNYGPDFVKKINGDFSFIIWDILKNELHVYRDHIGNYPFYYSKYNDSVMVSSFLPLILCQTYSPQVNKKWVRETLMNNVSPKNETCYENIFRFKPAHYYTFSGSGIKAIKYWNFDFKGGNGLNNDHLKLFRTKLSDSVLLRQGPGNSGCELSAGLDSSSIAATILNHSALKLQTYTHAIPPEAKDNFKPFRDETGIIDLLKAQYPNLNTNYISEPENSLLQDIKYCLMYTGELPQQQIHIMSKDIYQQAQQHNVNVLFSGFGGDEVISSYGYYYWLELLFKNRFLKLVKAIAQRKHKRITFIRLILKKLWDVKLHQLGFNHSVTRKYNKTLFLKGQALQEYIKKQRIRNEEPSKADYYYKKLKESVSIPHITSRIENSNVYGQYFGLTVKYPLVDKSLLEYYMGLPPRLHNSPQWPRKLMREALKNLVPEEIRLRRDKTIATVPNVGYRIYKNQHEIREFLKGFNRDSIILENLDIEKFSDFFEEYLLKCKLKDVKINPRTIINYLTILIFFDLYESGELFTQPSAFPPQNQIQT